MINDPILMDGFKYNSPTALSCFEHHSCADAGVLRQNDKSQHETTPSVDSAFRVPKARYPNNSTSAKRSGAQCGGVTCAVL